MSLHRDVQKVCGLVFSGRDRLLVTMFVSYIHLESQSAADVYRFVDLVATVLVLKRSAGAGHHGL